MTTFLQTQLTLLLKIAICVIALVPLSGCLNDDAGEIAFVRQVVPAVLGRRVQNVAEFDVLVELAETEGRGAVVDVLMEQPAFVDYWESVLFEKLRGLERRSSPRDMNSCADLPQLANHDGQVTEHIMNFSVDVAYAESFNLRDVVRDGIVADDLRPMALSNLLTMASAIDDQADASARFLSVYLNRNTTCLECHNSTFSKTDESSGWSRHYPLPWDLDGEVFGRTVDACPPRPYEVGSTFDENNGAQLYADHGCGGCHVNGSAPPHADVVPLRSDAQIIAAVREGGNGMSAYDETTISPDELSNLLAYMRIEFDVHNDYAAFAEAPCGDWKSAQSYFETANDCRDGEACALTIQVTGSTGSCFGLVCPPSIEVTPTPPPWGMSQSCGLHRHNEDATQTSTFAGESDHSVLGLVRAMKLGMVDLLITNAASDLLTNPPSEPTADMGPMGSRNLSFAYAVAASLTNMIGEELTGRSMRLAHGFSRNFEQKQVLFEGTHELLGGAAGGDERWSLKRVIREWVTSPAFNLQRPENSAESAPYMLLAFLDAWFDPDPRLGETVDPAIGVGVNGVGEIVHRFSYNSLLLQLHHALGWPKPSLLAFDDDPYLDTDLRRALGQPLTDELRGFDEVTFQSLLAWEAAFGQCPNPYSDAPDWIEMLGAAAGPDNTVEDLVEAVKWRLLQSVVGDVDERTAVETLFNGISLQDRLADSDLAEVEAGVRRFCGVLITSPQFMLAPANHGADIPVTPNLEACLDSEPCTVQAVYDAFAPALEAIGLSAWAPSELP